MHQVPYKTEVANLYKYNDKRLGKADWVVFIIIFIVAFASCKMFFPNKPATHNTSTVVNVSPCTYKDGERIYVKQFNKKDTIYICGFTTKPNVEFQIMIYDSYEEPIYGYRVIANDKKVEYEIKEDLSPGKYSAKIIGLRGTYDTIEFEILDQ